MKSPHTEKPLPEKVIHRLEQILFEILPPIEEAVQAVVPQIWSSRNGCGRVVNSVRATAAFSRKPYFAIFAGWVGRGLLCNRSARSSSAERLARRAHRKPMDSTSCPTYHLSCPASTFRRSIIEEKIGQLNQTFQSSLSETHLITPNAASVIHPDVLAHSLPPFSIALLHGFVHALNPTSSWTHWPQKISPLNPPPNTLKQSRFLVASICNSGSKKAPGSLSSKTSPLNV